MKKLIFSIVFLTVSASLACPGGHLKVLKYDGKAAFELNILTGKMVRVSSNKDIALLSLAITNTKNNQTVQICQEGKNSNNLKPCSKVLFNNNILGQKDDLNLTQVSWIVTVQLAGKSGPKLATIDNFNLTRGGCGQEIEAQ